MVRWLIILMFGCVEAEFEVKDSQIVKQSNSSYHT
ncbi:MAG: hypothetical protein ACJATN_000122 [Neolewinella sp.]|jgi:hypothetical protein